MEHGSTSAIWPPVPPQAASQMAVGLTPVSDESLATHVAEQLRDAIAVGTYPAGAHLAEIPLAEAFGVSRGPIREALAQLAREHHVVLRPRRGAIVREVTLEDARGIFELRMVLEQYAARRAATMIDAAGLAELERALKKIETDAAQATAQVVAKNDLSFHDVVYEAASHQRLLSFWRDLRQQVYVLLVRRNLSNTDFRDMAVVDHRALLDALSKHDPELAAATVYEQLESAMTRLGIPVHQPMIPVLTADERLYESRSEDYPPQGKARRRRRQET